MKTYAVPAVILAAILLVATGWAAHGLAQSTLAAVGSECEVTKIKFKTSDSVVSTAPITYVNVPDMQMSFTVGGSAPTCLEVEFSGAVNPPSGNIVKVRAILDGAAGLPAEADFKSSSAGVFTFDAQAFHFGFKDVQPGSHTLKIQWLSVAGGTVYMKSRSLFLHY